MVKYKSILKKIFIMAGVLVALGIITIVAANIITVSYSNDKLFSRDSATEKPLKNGQYDVGLLLGTTPQTRITRRRNYFFKYRIDAAEELYKTGIINTILISGDENSLDGVNEVKTMKDSLVARGVPARSIVLDGKGYRTLDAVVRARKIFGVRRFIVISQQFHNERAIYLANHLRLDVEDIIGYNAETPKYKISMMTYIREAFARVKMFWDIWTDKQPKELGDEQSIAANSVNNNLVMLMLDNNRVSGHKECDTILATLQEKVLIRCLSRPRSAIATY